MKTSLSAARLTAYVKHQLDHFFPDGRAVRVEKPVSEAIARIDVCFSSVKLSGYQLGGRAYFNHLHSDHYATFLYFASNAAWRMGDDKLAAKLYCLNKALNGFMCTYDTLLPERFLIIHSVGMLLGKATYSDYFVALHDVTIGTDRGMAPHLGRELVVCGGASIIGDCKIGQNVSVSAGSLILNQSVPDGHVVAKTSPALLMRPAKRNLIDVYFDIRR